MWIGFSGPHPAGVAKGAPAEQMEVESQLPEHQCCQELLNPTACASSALQGDVSKVTEQSGAGMELDSDFQASAPSGETTWARKSGAAHC